MTKDDLLAEYPNLHFLTAKDSAGMESYLRDRKWIERDECIVHLDKAGEGNMNCTLRAQTQQRTLIVKQSRPWVEKYPSIAAPWDRVRSEALFYKLVGSTPMAKRMPSLIGFDPDSRVLILEDLGESGDCTVYYGESRLPVDKIGDLTGWLSGLHNLPFEDSTRRGLENAEMRKLNHEHIFCFPLQAINGIDLDGITPGLREVADRLAADQQYVDVVTRLGECYLANGQVLLHGDFFPGSWLIADRGIRIIDPEFAFFGAPEFDVGVFLAHLHFCGAAEMVRVVRETYAAPAGFEWSLAEQYAGVELMRRLIGVAQLPLTGGLSRKKKLLQLSRSMVLEPE